MAEPRTMAFDYVGDVQVVVHTPGVPDPAEWAAFVRAARAIPKTVRSIVVWAPETVLDARQRSEISDITKQKGFNTAIFIQSAISRGVVTAVGWVTGRHRAFDPEDLPAAYDYLAIPIAQRAAVTDAIERLKKKLGTK